jgi:hypothetical protein
MSAQAASSRSRGLAPLLPWAVGAAGLGAAAVESPLVALGIGTAGVLVMLPWAALFSVLVVASTVQRWTYTVAGLTFRPDELVVAIFAARALAADVRFRLSWPEWCVVAFIGIQVLSSWIHSPDPNASLHTVALLSFGAFAYLATYATTVTRERLLFAVKVFFGVLAVAAAVGVAGLVAYYATGALWGVTRVDTLRGFPAALGVAYEHDIFGSTCAAGVISFYIFWREPNPVFTRTQSLAGFWVCAAGTLLSLARGAWIALAAGALVVFVASRVGGRVARGRLASLVVISGLVVLLGLGLVFVSGVGQGASQVGSGTAGAIGQQAGNVLNFGATTGAHRFRNWKIAIEEVRSSPILGLGTNSFGQRHFEQTGYGPIPAFLGNWAVRTLYDSGLVGLGLLLALLAAVAWPGPRVRGGDNELASIVRACVFAVVVLGVAYLATDAMLLAWPWVLLGLTRAARVLSRAEASGGVASVEDQPEARTEAGAS